VLFGVLAVMFRRNINIAYLLMTCLFYVINMVQIKINQMIYRNYLFLPIGNIMMPRIIFATFFLFTVVSATTTATTAAAELPNIVLILADDLGYGDVGAMNPDSKIKTPCIDLLALEGMRFRDMHSPSSVCTPTRYALLTGRYSWRSRLKNGVLGGYSPPLIEKERPTMASLLKKSGYHTAVIGKWHLGLDWTKKLEQPPTQTTQNGNKQNFTAGESEIDFSQPFTNGPLTLGFDYFFGISASLDMPPFVYLENDRVTEFPAMRKKWVRDGVAAEHFEAAEVLPKITEKAVKYLESRAESAKQGTPFFLYFPLNAPHAPILPSNDWKGKSGISDYADFVMQVDDTVGHITKTIDRLELAKNTIIIVTSDNGCSPVANFAQLRQHGHDPSGGFRGMKADIFDGGHRVPFIVRWSETIKPNTVADQLTCLVDLMATFAEITGQPLPKNSAEDTVSLLPVLRETATSPIHTEVIHHSVRGDFAVRQGDWKLCLCPGSGGWSEPKPGSAKEKELPLLQLYDMKSDPKETTNLEKEHPEKVRQLTSKLKEEIIPATKPLAKTADN
jgi:arylsulfatase A-like enzyme